MALFVFDAYGTLFDVHAAAGRYRDEIGPAYDRLSQVWRTKHIEYTWFHSQTNRPVSFWLLAERSLDYAIATTGDIPDGVRAKLLDAYRRMATFAEVPGVLRQLKSGGHMLAILSNGDPDMLSDAITAADLEGVFDAVISVQEAGIFKPSMAVYQLVHTHLGGRPADVTFLSSNRWDVAGANVFGFRTIWINRSGAADEYPDMPPGRVATSLRVLVD